MRFCYGLATNCCDSTVCSKRLKYTDEKGYEDLKLDFKNEKLKADIRSRYNLYIHQGRQDKHIKGTNNYNTDLNNGKINSYLLDGINPQEIVYKYAGTGEIRRVNGQWIKKQFFTHNEPIGYAINIETEGEILTKRFAIHYSKYGTHIVPMLEI